MMDSQNVVHLSSAGKRPRRQSLETDIPPPPKDGIAIIGGDLCIASEQAMDLILDKSPVYQRGGFSVRAARIPKAIKLCGFAIVEKSLILVPVEADWLAHELTRIGKFYKFDARTGRWASIDCPPKLAKSILALRGQWPFQWLRGISAAPTLRGNGSWALKDGHDKATGLYIDTGGMELKCATHPSYEDALAAVKKLANVMSEFPFVAAEDRSVAMAAICTALVRHTFPTAPLFAFDASAPGSGKTALADVVAMIATGSPAVTASIGSTPEESEKRLGALFMAAPPVICIDNLEVPLGGDFLCAALSRESMSVRVLGESRMADVPTSVTLCATGNNIEVVGDLCRRTLICRLDPKVERPDQRRFAVDLYKAVPRHHDVLVGCALTILKAYHDAGRPDMGLPPYGSFQEWSDWVRSALVWAGLADPCLTRTRLESVDPIVTELSAVMSAWSVCLPGGRAWTVRDLISQCESSACDDLKAALLDVAAARRNPNQIDPRRLGHWLKRGTDRLVGGRRIERAGDSHHATLWKVSMVS